MSAVLKQRPRRLSLASFHKKLLELKIRSFRPKVSFRIESKAYVVKTAETPEELKQVLELRQRIFSQSFGLKIRFFDFDTLDLLGDHITVKKVDSKEVIATYRVISSNFSRSFYSQSEFYIEEFLKERTSKLELGRACISEELRNGRGLDLVWRGLAHYAGLTGARYMFGCTSVKTTRPLEAMSIYEYCDPEAIGDEFNIYPMPKYQFPRYFAVPTENDVEQAKGLLPPLFRSYLKAGAKVYGRPALDRKFSCTDLFTIIDLETLNPTYRKRYFRGGESAATV